MALEGEEGSIPSPPFFIRLKYIVDPISRRLKI
jgi:hypothetical protein